MKLKTLLHENVKLNKVESPDQLKGITDVVDVTGDVKLYYKDLETIPAKFGKVGGRFYCSNNHLTSLEGCPNEVGGDFYGHGNYLTSLEGCPSEVGGDFCCDENHLTSLVGIHKLIKKMNGIFYVHNNLIKEGGIGLLLINGLTEIYTDHPALEIIDKYVSQGKMGILACQEELIENGYEDFTKL